MCAHGRSYEFYAESVYPGNELNFISTRCNSIGSLKRGKCSGKRIPMGIATPSSAKGNHFLHTNSRPPFGMSRTSKTWNLAKISGSKCEYPKSNQEIFWRQFGEFF